MVANFLEFMCIWFNAYINLVHALHSDRVLCHFCFKPKKVTNEVLGTDNARRSRVLISSIILLKTALEALPLLSKVNLLSFACTIWFYLVYFQVMAFKHFRCLKMQKVFFLQIFTRLYVKMRNMLPSERGISQFWLLNS